MLSDYVVDIGVQERLRRGPAGIHLETFADWLADRCYAVATIRSYILAADRFMDWWNCASDGGARFHYGEEGDKGFLVWQVDADGADCTLHPTPARRTVDICFEGKPVLDELRAAVAAEAIAAGALGGPECNATAADARASTEPAAFAAEAVSLS